MLHWPYYFHFIKILATLGNSILSHPVESSSIFQEVIKNRKWQKVREALKLPHASSSGAQLRSIYISYFPNCASIANALTKTVNKGGHYTSRGGGEIKMKPIGNKKIRKKKS